MRYGCIVEYLDGVIVDSMFYVCISCLRMCDMCVSILNVGGSVFVCIVLSVLCNLNSVSFIYSLFV